MLLVWLAIALPFVFLYLVSRRSVINEVRQHAMGVAIAAAAGLEHELLGQVHGPEDTALPAYRAIQKQLDRMVANNPDIHFLYTMRRSPEPFAPPHALEYVVDQAAMDRDGDGQIGRDEISELPGTPYDASAFPAMVAGWDRPDADLEVTPDPPYPDLISGYAPVRDAAGRTVALVGADVTAHTVVQKLRVIQLVVACIWLLVCVLVTLVIHLYHRQRAAFDEIKRLNDELAARHDFLRRATQQLTAPGAQPPPDAAELARPRLLFDRYYLRIAQAGAAPAGVFDLDQDHAAFYLASLSGSAARVALVDNLVRIALATLAERTPVEASATVRADLQDPAAVLALLSRLVSKELPPEETVSLAYGVLDLARNECALAFAGAPFAVLRWQKNGRAEVVQTTGGPAICAGVIAGDYPVGLIRTAEGDRIVVVDATAGAPTGRTPEQVGSALLAVAMEVRARPLLDQVTALAGPGAPAPASLLGLELR